MIVCDGQGYAHPKRAGLACHVGVAREVPTIGCAKNRLIGACTPPEQRRGSWAPLFDEYTGGNPEIVGAVLRTRTDVKPVFVSPGHLIDVAGAVEIVLTLTPRYRLPETTRQADRLANQLRQELDSG